MRGLCQSEQMKLKHTLAGHVLELSVGITVLLAFLMTAQYYQIDSYNWWYITLLPAGIALACGLGEQREKRLKYQNCIAMPVNPALVWYARIWVMAVKLAASALLLTGLILGCRYLLNQTAIYEIGLGQQILACIVLTCCSLFLIPLSFWISSRIGVFGALLVQLSLSLWGSCVVSLTPVWFLCPYSYAARLMCPILGVLPNGLPAVSGSAFFQESLLSWGVVGPGVLLGLLVFGGSTWLTGRWFQKKEAK